MMAADAMSGQRILERGIRGNQRGGLCRKICLHKIVVILFDFLGQGLREVREIGRREMRTLEGIKPDAVLAELGNFFALSVCGLLPEIKSFLSETATLDDYDAVAFFENGLQESASLSLASQLIFFIDAG